MVSFFAVFFVIKTLLNSIFLADSFIAFDGNRFENTQFSTDKFHNGFVLYGVKTDRCYTADQFEELNIAVNVNEIVQVELTSEDNILDDRFVEIGRCKKHENGEARGKCLIQMQETSMEFSHCVHVRDPRNSYVEWGRVMAESMYTTGKAYEIWVKWLMATGQTVVDIVLKNWARGGTRIGFNLFAVPEDMFAEPTNPLSSPLRCPIFVTINHKLIIRIIVSLRVSESIFSMPFQEEENEKKEKKKIPEDLDNLLPYQFSIIMRKALKAFGFIPISCPEHWKNQHREDLQYVHMCGGMFVQYDARYDRFLWSWNHLFSQLYRSSMCTESFLDMMLKDFREFWDNKGGKLTAFITETFCSFTHFKPTEISAALQPESFLFNGTWDTLEDIQNASNVCPLKDGILKYLYQVEHSPL